MADLSTWFRAFLQRMLNSASPEDGLNEAEVLKRLRLAFGVPGVSSAGVLNLSWMPSGLGFFDVHAYGAAGDGSTDDTAAIGLAATAAGQGGIVLFRPGKTYKITSTLSILFDDQVWWMYGALVGLSTANFAGITIGSNTTQVRRAKIYGGIVQPLSGALDWTTGGVGYRLLKCNNCSLHDISVRWLEKGVEITSPAPPNQSESTQNWIEPQMIASCALPIYIYANDSGTANENTFRGGEVSYSGSDPSATGRYAVTIDKHASANGNVNGTKFLGTYFGCSKVSNKPSAFYINGVGTYIDGVHCENYPLPLVTWGADALAGGVPQIIFGGGADWTDPEADLAAGTTGTAAAYFFVGRDGSSVSGGNQAGSDYVFRVKQLGAATKKALSIANSANTETATITGEGIVSGTWVKNGGTQELSTQLDRAATTTFANVFQKDIKSGRTYAFEARCRLSADVTGGSKIKINASSGLTASLIWYELRLFNWATSAYTTSKNNTAFDSVQNNAGVTAGVWEINGTVVATADGSLNVQFAQDSATGTSSILVGSTFTVTDVTP